MNLESLSPSSKWEEEKMADGEKWFHTTIAEVPENSLVPKNSTLLVTAEGKKLFAHNDRLLKKLLVFKRSSNKKKEAVHVRKYLGGEGNGSVYAVGRTGIAIKEAGTQQSVHWALERMDGLYRAIENGKRHRLIPEWIGLPKHYGYLIPPISTEDQRQYMLMQQIDSGVTIEDVRSLSSGTIEDRERIQNRLGTPLTQTEIQGIEEQWKKLEGFLNTAIVQANTSKGVDEQRTFKQMVPDFHEGNVLIERVKFPKRNGDEPFKLWVIDQ